eukprot:GHVQ01012770.1.p1 GENE.GHVQ01012770.1~~GHVQ01012770.1.p1  ORF type:complete len:378 (-),score=49.52 GHVQ01012770.1:1195-2328(-)
MYSDKSTTAKRRVIGRRILISDRPVIAGPANVGHAASFCTAKHRRRGHSTPVNIPDTDVTGEVIPNHTNTTTNDKDVEMGMIQDSPVSEIEDMSDMSDKSSNNRVTCFSMLNESDSLLGIADTSAVKNREATVQVEGLQKCYPVVSADKHFPTLRCHRNSHLSAIGDDSVHESWPALCTPPIVPSDRGDNREADDNEEDQKIRTLIPCSSPASKAYEKNSRPYQSKQEQVVSLLDSGSSSQLSAANDGDSLSLLRHMYYNKIHNALVDTLTGIRSFPPYGLDEGSDQLSGAYASHLLPLSELQHGCTPGFAAEEMATLPSKPAPYVLCPADCTGYDTGSASALPVPNGQIGSGDTDLLDEAPCFLFEPSYNSLRVCQ